MRFKEWLKTQEQLDEDWKNWAKRGVVAATLAAPIFGGVQKYVDSPTGQAIQQRSDIPVKNLRQTSGSPSQYLGFSGAWKLKQSGSDLQTRIDLGKQYAKQHFKVSDDNIFVMKASDYIKKVWGNQYDKVVAKAKIYGHQDLPGMPDVNNLDEPIVVVRGSDPESADAGGTCRKIGSGLSQVVVCQINPDRWGDNPTSREELTHSMQRGTQGDLPTSKTSLATKTDEYASNTAEFGAKLAELKRFYFQQTGQEAKDAEDLLNWGVKNYSEIPESVRSLVVYYSGTGEHSQKIIDYANKLLPGLVMSQPRTFSNDIGKIV